MSTTEETTRVMDETIERGQRVYDEQLKAISIRHHISMRS